MLEIWKDIKGYEGLYQISSFGRIKSFRGKEKILKPNAPNGYFQITLRGKSYRVARLVAKAFIPNPNNLPQVNHKDLNKQNDRVDNLEWCTCKQNVRHAIANGVKIGHGGSRRIESIKQFDLDGNYLAVYPSMRQAVDETGVNLSCLSGALKGRLRTAGRFKWSCN